MIPTIQRMTDVAQIHLSHPRLFESLPLADRIDEDALKPLLLGLGELGCMARSSPEDRGRFTLVGADTYLLVALLTAGRTSPPPTEGDLARLAVEQLERYTGNPHRERWRDREPLDHLMAAIQHWMAVAPVLSVRGSGPPRGLTRVQLADLANYLTFFLSVSGALDRLPDAAAAG